MLVPNGFNPHVESYLPENLQDVLDDVSRTEIPSLDDDEAAATKAPAAMLGAKKPSRVPATQVAHPCLMRVIRHALP